MNWKNIKQKCIHFLISIHGQLKLFSNNNILALFKAKKKTKHVCMYVIHVLKCGHLCVTLSYINKQLDQKWKIFHLITRRFNVVFIASLRVLNIHTHTHTYTHIHIHIRETFSIQAWLKANCLTFWAWMWVVTNESEIRKLLIVNKSIFTPKYQVVKYNSSTHVKIWNTLRYSLLVYQTDICRGFKTPICFLKYMFLITKVKTFLSMNNFFPFSFCKNSKIYVRSKS